MSLTMYDSVTVSEIPADAQAAAGYVNGRFANIPALRRHCPGAHILTIAISADADADCLDIETGDATPAQAAGWYARQVARGITRPCLYASASVMQGSVVPLIEAAGILRPFVRLWSAHYTGTAHICSPSSCGEMSIAADATQYTDRALGRNLDASLVADDFFGITSALNWQEALLNKLPVLSQGAQDKPGNVYYVHRMQALIKTVAQIKNLPGASCLEVTGTFDAATTTALKAVQASFGIAADAVCGPQSWSVLLTGSAR